MMPGMDGETLFHRLRAENPHLKMVIMSGYPLGGTGTTLSDQGLVSWVQKPISFGQLSQVVSEAMSN